MATARQDADFKKEVIMDQLPDSLLDDAVDFIGKTLNPEDVFSAADLKKWAEAQGPDELFSSDALEEWATENGWIKE